MRQTPAVRYVVYRDTGEVRYYIEEGQTWIIGTYPTRADAEKALAARLRA